MSIDAEMQSWMEAKQKREDEARQAAGAKAASAG